MKNKITSIVLASVVTIAGLSIINPATSEAGQETPNENISYELWEKGTDYKNEFKKFDVDMILEDELLDLSQEIDGHPVGDIYLSNGRTFVPIRFFSEALGFDVSWERINGYFGLSSKEKSSIIAVTVKKDDTVIVVDTGHTGVRVNGRIVPIEEDEAIRGKIRPVVIDQRTYIPLRFIVETLGLDIEYRDSNRSDVKKPTIYINSTNIPKIEDIKYKLPEGVKLKSIDGNVYTYDFQMQLANGLRVSHDNARFTYNPNTKSWHMSVRCYTASGHLFFYSVDERGTRAVTIGSLDLSEEDWSVLGKAFGDFSKYLSQTYID